MPSTGIEPVFQPSEGCVLSIKLRGLLPKIIPIFCPIGNAYPDNKKQFHTGNCFLLSQSHATTNRYEIRSGGERENVTLPLTSLLILYRFCYLLYGYTRELLHQRTEGEHTNRACT